MMHSHLKFQLWLMMLTAFLFACVHKRVVLCLSLCSYKNWDRLLIGLHVVCPRVRVQRDAVRGTLPATEVCWPLPGPAQCGGSLLFSSPSCQTQILARAAPGSRASSGCYPNSQKPGAVCAEATPSSASQGTPAHTTALEKFLHICSTMHGGCFLHLFWYFLWATVGT